MKLFQEKIQSILLVLFILFQAITPAFADNAAYIIPETDGIKVNNECERIIEGKIEFFLPEIEKKGIDLVIVNDLSGPLDSTINDLKVGLKQLASSLDYSKDKLMLTSFKEHNNTSYFQSGEDFVKGKLNAPSLISNSLDIGLNPITNNTKDIYKYIDDLTIGSKTPVSLSLLEAFNNYKENENETIFLLLLNDLANVDLNGVVNINTSLDISKHKFENEDYKQLYKNGVSEVLEVSEKIKNKDYHIMAAFIENEEILKGPEKYGPIYPSVGKYYKDILSRSVSDPKYFINFNKTTDLYKEVGPLLSNLIANLSNNKIKLNLNNDYTLVDLSIEGRKIYYDNNNGKITVALDNLESGKYTLKYKVKENKNFKDNSKIMDGKMIILPVESKDFIIHEFEPIQIRGNNNKCTETSLSDNINWDDNCAELNGNKGSSNGCRRPELIESKTKEYINKKHIITEEIEVSLPLVGTPINILE